MSQTAFDFRSRRRKKPFNLHRSVFRVLAEYRVEPFDGAAELEGVQQRDRPVLCRSRQLYRILGTGLLVSGTANNSGPYSNITFNTGGLANATTVCAQISGASTKGIHALTCLATSGTPTAAVLLTAFWGSKGAALQHYVTRRVTLGATTRSAEA